MTTDEPKPHESPAAEAAPEMEAVPAPIPDVQPEPPSQPEPPKTEPTKTEPTKTEPTKTEDVTPPATTGPTFDRRVIGLGITVGLGLLVLLLGLMVFAPGIAPIKFGAVGDAQRAERESEVEDVATKFASSLYSFSYRTIDSDLEKIRRYSTGNFSKELASVLGEVDVFKKAIVEARGESRGVVEGIDVREMQDDTATARVFINQSIKNKKNPTPRQQFAAIELTLVETSGGWKVDDVKQFTSGAPQASPKG